MTTMPSAGSALVLGASGSIGLAIALELLRRGYRVLGTCHSHPERLAALQQAHPSDFTSLQIDLRDLDSTTLALSCALDSFTKDQGGCLRVTINAAGLAARPTLLLRCTHQQVQDVVGVNLTGAIVAVKIALPFLLRSPESAVLQLGSVSATGPTPGLAPYAAAKAGLEGFSLALAREYAKRGLAATCIRLGPVDSDMTRALGQARHDVLAASLPRAELPDIASIATTIASLVSMMLAGHINGQPIPVDCGYMMWRQP